MGWRMMVTNTNPRRAPSTWTEVSAYNSPWLSGETTQEQAVKVLNRLALAGLSPLIRRVLLERALHDPGSFRVESDDFDGTRRVWFFEATPDGD